MKFKLARSVYSAVNTEIAEKIRYSSASKTNHTISSATQSQSISKKHSVLVDARNKSFLETQNIYRNIRESLRGDIE